MSTETVRSPASGIISIYPFVETQNSSLVDRYSRACERSKFVPIPNGSKWFQMVPNGSQFYNLCASVSSKFQILEKYIHMRSPWSASVCLSVYDYSGTTGNEAASERYQKLQCNKRSKTKQAILLKRRRSRSSNWHCRGRPSPSISDDTMGLAPPSVFPVPACISLPPLASLPLPLAAQRNGEKRMCQSGLPADAASLRETGSVDRYTPPVGPCPIE